jgi:predicted  nucleic acid-binding Zn-ribbon protein
MNPNELGAKTSVDGTSLRGGPSKSFAYRSKKPPATTPTAPTATPVTDLKPISNFLLAAPVGEAAADEAAETAEDRALEAAAEAEATADEAAPATLETAAEADEATEATAEEAALAAEEAVAEADSAAAEPEPVAAIEVEKPPDGPG